MCPSITIGKNGAYRCRICRTGVCRHMGLHCGDLCPNCHDAQVAAQRRDARSC